MNKYYLALRDIIVFCVLAICIIVCTSANSREVSNAVMVAHEIQVNHDYVDTKILQSRLFMLDIVSPLTSTTQQLTQIACIQAGVVCEKEEAPFKYQPPLPDLSTAVPYQPITGEPQ